MLGGKKLDFAERYNPFPVLFLSFFKFARGCGFGGNVSRIKIARVFSLFIRKDDAELF